MFSSWDMKREKFEGGTLLISYTLYTLRYFLSDDKKNSDMEIQRQENSLQTVIAQTKSFSNLNDLFQVQLMFETMIDELFPSDFIPIEDMIKMFEHTNRNSKIRYFKQFICYSAYERWKLFLEFLEANNPNLHQSMTEDQTNTTGKPKCSIDNNISGAG